MSSLEARDFVASPADIEGITKAVLEAQSTSTEGRASFLCALVGTTQHALDSPPRQRQTTVEKTNQETRAKQLEAFEAVNAKFYLAVVKAAKEASPTGKPQELNKRTNFARTAASMLRSWIRAGNDVTCLAAARVTKASLAVPGRHRAPSPLILSKQTRRWADSLTKTATKLAGIDKQVAQETLESVIAKLTSTLASLTGGRARVASRSHTQERVRAAA